MNLINSELGAKMIGLEAIEHAKATGAQLNKYEDPTEGAVSGISIEDAEAVASEDPSLIWCWA